MTIPDAVAAYRAYLHRQERSPATIDKYSRDLTRFFRDTGAGPRPGRDAVAQWRDALLAAGYTARSVNCMLASVNGYQVFTGRPEERARPLKVQRRAYRDAGRELNRGDYFRLLETARRLNRRRLLLALQTLAATGVRVSELRFITAEAVRQGRAAVNCKGKCREIFLPRALCTRLQTWCRRQHIHTGCVFVTRGGRPLDRSNLWREMKALCALAGVDPRKVFPHNLRHLFARTFYSVEKDLSKLADLLGHTSIETTRIYIMESGREHQKLLDRMKLLL